MNEADLNAVARVVNATIAKRLEPIREQIVSLEKSLPVLIEKAIDVETRLAVAEVRDSCKDAVTEAKDALNENRVQMIKAQHSFEGVATDCKAYLEKIDQDSIAQKAIAHVQEQFDQVVNDIKGSVPTAEVITEALVEQADIVSKVASVLPAPEPGKDGADGKDGKDGIDGADGKDGSNGKDGAKGLDGKDGKDGKDGIDRPIVDLVEPLRQGETVKRGEVRSWGGSIWQATKDVDCAPDQVHEGWQVLVAGIGAHKTFQAEDDPRRIITETVVAGETDRKEFYLPVPIHTGPHEIGKTYQMGDEVAIYGGTFRAVAPTQAKPGESPDWICVAKSGSRGKPGLDGAKGDKGDAGPKGKDGKDGASIVKAVRDGSNFVFIRDDDYTVSADGIIETEED